MGRRNWTRKELLLALNLYCKLPFSKYDQRTPEVQELATIIDRTPSAVAMKLSNFASLDETHQERGVVGLGNVSQLDVEVWQEFTGTWDAAVTESEALLEEATSTDASILEVEEPYQHMTETEGWSKIRLGQKFFRDTILANYRQQCCICDLELPALLIASHIVPWSYDELNRLNPQNGLSLCAIHDKAFDRGFITLSSTLSVMLSERIHELPHSPAIQNFLLNYQNKQISLPVKFIPHPEFVDFHRAHIFIT